MNMLKMIGAFKFGKTAVYLESCRGRSGNPGRSGWTYGGVARMAGSARAARQVVRILHTCSRREGLPWQRVVNREGRISLKPGYGYEEQKELLADEGVEFDLSDRIDFDRFLWNPGKFLREMKRVFVRI